MPPKRKRGKQYSGPPSKKSRGSSYSAAARQSSRIGAARTLQSVVRRALARHMESKMTNQTSSDGVEIGHNSFLTMDSNMLETTQGVGDGTTGTANRIGDEITLKGISMKFMIELNERYTDVTFRMFVVKKAKGDTLDASTFFRC